MNSSTKLFICRVKPWGTFTIFTDRNKVVKWWKANEDSYGEREVKMVRWSVLKTAKGFKEGD